MVFIISGVSKASTLALLVLQFSSPDCFLSKTLPLFIEPLCFAFVIPSPKFKFSIISLDDRSCHVQEPLSP